MAIEQLEVVTVLKKDRVETWNKISAEWDKYFEIDHVMITPSEFKNYLDKRIDILFIDDRSYNLFKLAYYKVFRDKEPSFKLVVIKEKSNEDDKRFLKLLADDMIFLDNTSLAKWKAIANLRRYWSTYSKPTTIIHKGIIADFIDNVVTLDGKELNLTVKEILLLRYFTSKVGQFVTKKDIFVNVWKETDDDSSRVVDQILFKLKRKIGDGYFIISRQKGVKFE